MFKPAIRKWGGVGAVLLALFLALQILPLGAPRTNPPILAEPAWDSPQTRALARRACFDCHSNETVWPVYAYVAPVSWLVTRDVVEGRARMNFSEWGTSSRAAADIVEEIEAGRMPLPPYLLLHPAARLTDAEKELFIRGLHASLE